MMRLFTLAALLSILLFGRSYSPVMLQAQASIFPKIVLLQKKQRAEGEPIRFAVIYQESDYAVANSLKERMESLYGSADDLVRVDVSLIRQTELGNDIDADAVMILWLDEASRDQVVKIAQKRHIPTFAFFVEDLKHELLFALSIEKRVNIYLNKSRLRAYNIYFDDVLYRMTKFVE